MRNPDRYQRIRAACQWGSKDIDLDRHCESIYLICEEASLREQSPRPGSFGPSGWRANGVGSDPGSAASARSARGVKSESRTAAPSDKTKAAVPTKGQ